MNPELIFFCVMMAIVYMTLSRRAGLIDEAWERSYWISEYCRLLREYDSKTAVVNDYVWDDDEVESMNRDLRVIGRRLNAEIKELV